MIRNVSLFTTTDLGRLEFSGSPSWVYYLFGVIFLLLFILNFFYAIKYRNSRNEYINIANSFGTFKKFWYLNRFLFFVILSIVFCVSSIIFFMMNTVFLSGN